MSRVLAILPEGFEEIETVAPVDLLRRAGIDVVLASLGVDLPVRGRSGIVLHADTTLNHCLAEDFDCLFLPGGPGVKILRTDDRVKTLVRSFSGKGRWIAAICAAPAVLMDLGVLEGRRYTAHFSVQQELPSILAGMRVVVDGHLITSRGAGTSIDFGLSLIEHLVSPAKAREIANAICF